MRCPGLIASLIPLVAAAGCSGPSNPGDALRDLAAAPVVDLALPADASVAAPSDLAEAADLVAAPRDLTVGGDIAVESCNAMEARYLRLAEGAAATSCAGQADCKLLTGHCGVGLGGCYYAVNGSTNQADLDAIALTWKAMGCDAGRPVCRCAPPRPVECSGNTCRIAP